MTSLTHLAPVDPPTPLTLIQSATAQANDAIKASNPRLTVKWIGIIVLIIIVIILICLVSRSGSSSVTSYFGGSARGESKILPLAAIEPTYTSQLTRATDDCAGHMVFTVVENNPALQDVNSSLAYPTNVYRNKNSVLTNPAITVTAGGNVYRSGGRFGFIGAGELIWLTIARTDLPAELLSIPGPWTIKADFISKPGDDRSTKTSNIAVGGLLDSTFDDVNDYCPYASWRS